MHSLKEWILSLWRRELILYHHVSAMHSDGRSPAHILQGDRRQIEKYISTSEMTSLFGGLIRSRADTPSGEVVGVWGKRHTARLRRLLCERGASVIVREGSAPNEAPALSAGGVS